MTLALTVGFGGAAVLDSVLLTPALAAADELGPGDGLTRLVVQAAGGVTAEQVAALDALAGVDSAQPLFDGSALVAGKDVTAGTVQAVLPGAEVTLSESSAAYASSVSDPYWARYGWNLENTGSNAYEGRVQATQGADVSAPTGWQAGTGRGTVVAVVDTGYAPSHPDMAGALWTKPGEPCGASDVDGNGYAGDCHGWNFYRNSPDLSNGGDNAHGTAVAGIIGARAGNGEGNAGVAPDVTIMPLVIGGGGSLSADLGAQAVVYAADNGADVVNLSWGSVDPYYGPGIPAGYQRLASAIAYAEKKGVVVVAAAGNDSMDRDTAPKYPASFDAPNLITVGSSTARDTVAGHSAYGARTVDLFAPGEYVVVHTSAGGYSPGSGTSYAAPHVAAAVALYRAHDRAATPEQLKATLLADVQHLSAFAGRSVTGGRLALDALGNTAAPVSYTFSAMAADAGTVAPRVVATGTAPAGDYEVVLGLGMEQGGQVYALTDHEITLDGVTATTDDDGGVTFPLGHRSALGSVVLEPTTDLHEGRYVLTAQVVRDGSALGLAYAAPLLVGEEARRTAPTPGTPTPGTPVPGTPVPGTPVPGTPVPGTPVPGTPVPGTPVPGTPSPGTPTPGTPTPGTPVPGTPTPGTPAPGTPTPGTPSPGTPGTPDPETPGTPDPGTPGPGTPTPGTPSPGTPGTPDPGTPTPGTPTPGTPTPDLGGRKDYPETGPHRLTSISPTRVSTAGGTQVTITGSAIPAGASVRIGGTTSAQVTGTTTSTRLTFRTPALVAGSYDVYVFGPDRKTYSVLTDGLTYVDAGSTPAPGTPAPGTPSPGTPAPGTPTPGTPAPGIPVPVTPVPGTPAPGTGGEVTGPNGERLRPSARFASLGSSIWSINCSTTCSGLAV